MKGKGGFSFTASLPDGLRAYQKKVDMDGQDGADFRARSDMALMFLNVCNQGSAKDPTVPPILTGNLRGSSSVFVGSVLIMTTRGQYAEGTPLVNYSDNPRTVTVVYNTAYAARMHEDTWEPGPRSEQSGNVGNKWVERHLAADGPDLLEFYARKLKEYTGA